MNDFNEYPKIQVRNSEGKVISTFHTIGIRGRELAERDVKQRPDGCKAYLVHNRLEENQKGGIEIPLVVGKYNDVLLDHPELPDSCRALRYL